MKGRLLSVNVGQPKPIVQGTRTVMTAIFKSPIEGRVAVRGHQIAGDRQADPRVHGGPYKAVYLYPSEHYPLWREELGLAELPYGAFGENLTSEGLLETEAGIGDQFRVGTTVLQVTQPRMPCFKLALRFERADMVKQFWARNRPGIYFSVVREGELGAGDEIELVSKRADSVSVTDVVRLAKGEEWSGDVRARALKAPLYGGWKDQIQSRLVEDAG